MRAHSIMKYKLPALSIILASFLLAANVCAAAAPDERDEIRKLHPDWVEGKEIDGATVLHPKGWTTEWEPGCDGSSYTLHPAGSSYDEGLHVDRGSYNCLSVKPIITKVQVGGYPAERSVWKEGSKTTVQLDSLRPANQMKSEGKTYPIISLIYTEGPGIKYAAQVRDVVRSIRFK